MTSGRLRALRLDAQQRRAGAVRLNLFADTNLNAVFERTVPTASGYTLTGRIEGQPASTVVFAVNGEYTSGMVWTAEAVYTIEAIGDSVAIRQASSAAFGQCLTAEHAARDATRPRPPRPPAPSSDTTPEEPEDDGSVVDVLVVYPSLARRSHGGHRAMRAVIDRDVEFANAAYRASGALQRINLVAAVELEYAEAEEDTNMFRLLDHLVDPASGYMDEAHALRDSYAADMVLQHRGDLAGSGVLIGSVAGIAFQMTKLSAEDEAPYAFSISTSFAFAHELGHGMGLRHHRALDVDNTPFPYSHGYVVHHESESLDELFTIMAYGPAEKRIPRFSNLQQNYPDENGVAIGVAGEAPSDSPDGPADAARSLNETRRIVANFRRSANRCVYSLSPPPSDLPASGGEYRVQVRTRPDCAWSAHSNDAFVTVAADASGAGNGEVAYSVSANTGWEREVAVMVAGEAYVVEQAGDRTLGPVDVCQRPYHVWWELERTLAKPCADITASDLALVRELHIHHQAWVQPSWAGAFLGLVNLASLELDSGDLVTLQVGMFDGLPNLHQLILEDNYNLQTIQSGAFNGLANLRELRLDEALTSLQPGAFHGLYNLRKLTLRRAQLALLPEGAFDGLSELTELIFTSEPLTRVTPGAFRGLPSLEYLVFNGTSIETLLPNVFEGLQNLDDLVLRYHDRLTILPPGVFNGLPKLRYLDIHENALTSLPNGLFDALPSLRILSVWYNNELTVVEAGTLNDLRHLESLYLSNNALTTLDAGALHGLSDLEVFNLSGNSISDISALSTLTNLQALHLNVNSISNVAPLVANAGLGRGDYVRLDGNPWSAGIPAGAYSSAPPERGGGACQPCGHHRGCECGGGGALGLRSGGPSSMAKRLGVGLEGLGRHRLRPSRKRLSRESKRHAHHTRWSGQYTFPRSDFAGRRCRGRRGVRGAAVPASRWPARRGSFLQRIWRSDDSRRRGAAERSPPGRLGAA